MKDLENKLYYYNELIYNCRRVIEQLSSSYNDINAVINNMNSGCKIDGSIYASKTLVNARDEIKNMMNILQNSVLPNLWNKVYQIDNQIRARAD